MSDTDYGEPWTCDVDRLGLKITEHGYDGEVFHITGDFSVSTPSNLDKHKRDLQRAVACVNALAGVENPEALVSKVEHIAEEYAEAGHPRTLPESLRRSLDELVEVVLDE